MSIPVLSTREASVLKAFDNDYVGLVAELAFSARLTPSEIRAAVDALQAKDLVRVNSKGASADISSLVELTKAGQDVRRQLQSGKLMVYSDEGLHSDEEVDRALNEAIEKSAGQR